jgi:hypothetical protein
MGAACARCTTSGGASAIGAAGCCAAVCLGGSLIMVEGVAPSALVSVVRWTCSVAVGSLFTMGPSTVRGIAAGVTGCVAASSADLWIAGSGGVALLTVGVANLSARTSGLLCTASGWLDAGDSAGVGDSGEVATLSAATVR